MKDIQSLVQKLGQLNQPLSKLLSESGKKCFSKEVVIPQQGNCRDQMPTEDIYQCFVLLWRCERDKIHFQDTFFVVDSEEQHCFIL